MAGYAFRAMLKDLGAQRALRKMEQRAEKVRPLLQAVGVLLLRSIDLNFEKGGRPKKWKARRPWYARRMKKRGKTKTLIVSGDMMNSVTAQVEGDKLILGSNMVYAGVHQFGAKKGEFGTKPVANKIGYASRSGATLYAKGRQMPIPWGDIPARPFILVQDEDHRRINRMAGDYFEGKP
jgi:phage virion morphogenesis protein